LPAFFPALCTALVLTVCDGVLPAFGNALFSAFSSSFFSSYFAARFEGARFGGCAIVADRHGEILSGRVQLPRNLVAKPIGKRVEGSAEVLV
jgi:hypothetical protein